MYKFNPDGSLQPLAQDKQAINEKNNRLKNQRCIIIKKEILSDKSPKECRLNIKLSDQVKDSGFIEKIYNYFKENSEVPSKLSKVNDREWEVKVGTCFRRCSDCSSLITRYREFLDGNVIEEKGSCTFERRSQNFCYEDYF